MSPPLVFGVGSIMKFNGNRITDHNRKALSINPERIENRTRMANGTLRNFVVATKSKFKVSWSDLPRQNERTVDGFWGAQALEDFYYATVGEFSLTVTHGDNTTDAFIVMFESFNSSIDKRGAYTDFYNVDLTLEEV